MSEIIAMRGGWKLWCVFTLLSLFATVSNGQSTWENIDDIALKMPPKAASSVEGFAAYVNAHFQTEDEKIRAIFIWIASNLEYDSEQLYSEANRKKRDEKVIDVLRTHRGVCDHYASLFAAVCNAAGIKNYLVEGITRQGKDIDQVAHVWNAASINGKWYFYDPTWGSGYVSGNKFFRDINNQFFQVEPSMMVKTHMPFDPLWQFSERPLTYDDFYARSMSSTYTGQPYSIQDSLQVWEKLEHPERITAAARRIEQNGRAIALVKARLRLLAKESELVRLKEVAVQYNEAASTFNEAVTAYNQYLKFRKEKFAGTSPMAMQTLLDKSSDQFELVLKILHNIEEPDSKMKSMIAQMVLSLEKVIPELRQEKLWLAGYHRQANT